MLALLTYFRSLCDVLLMLRTPEVVQFLAVACRFFGKIYDCAVQNVVILILTILPPVPLGI